MFRKLIILFIATVMAFSLKSHAQENRHLPANPYEAIAYLERAFSGVRLDSFRIRDERSAVAYEHFGIGLWIRNTWLRGQYSKLDAYFLKRGVRSTDDMSGIVLTSLHRKLNHERLSIEDQISHRANAEKVARSCHNSLRKASVSEYRKHNIGDTVSILMPVAVTMSLDSTAEIRMAYTTTCPQPAWNFNKSRDLIITGKITKKYTINVSDNVFFKITVIKLNRTDTEVGVEKLSIGKELDFSLVGLRIE